MPGATTARLVDPAAAMPWNDDHDPPHGAEQPDVRRDRRRRREKRHAVLELGDLRGRRAQQRAIHGFQTPEGWTRAPVARLVLAGAAQLRVQLRVARLKEPDERTRRQARAHGLHFREAAALAEDVEERRVCFVARRSCRCLKKMMPHETAEKSSSVAEHGLHDRIGVENERDDVGLREPSAEPAAAA